MLYPVGEDAPVADMLMARLSWAKAEIDLAIQLVVRGNIAAARETAADVAEALGR